jgi:hypothetical protein
MVGAVIAAVGAVVGVVLVAGGGCSGGASPGFLKVRACDWKAFGATASYSFFGSSFTSFFSFSFSLFRFSLEYRLPPE